MPLNVLRHLSADEFRSGEDVARRLGVSRASVHNAVREAEALGIGIHAVRGKGYRLVHAWHWLDAGQLNRDLQALGYRVQVHDHLDSTNTVLMREGQAGAPHKTVIAAESQAAGRGRRGREWLAPLGMRLTFSVLWRFQRPLTALSGLSLAVGLALGRSLRNLDGDVRVKWPNDLLHDGRKLAGILIETQGDVLAGATAVIGIGVNVDATPDMSERVGVPVASVREAVGRRPDRNDLLARLLRELNVILDRFDQDGFGPFQAEWMAMSAHVDAQVAIQGAGEHLLQGRFAGVDAEGALLLDTGGGMRRVHSGEVSLRPCS